MAKVIKKIAGFESNRRFYRKFGNHEYWNSGEVSSKAHAQKQADRLKGEGYFVRITKATLGTPGWYALWVSPKKE